MKKAYQLYLKKVYITDSMLEAIEKYNLIFSEKCIFVHSSLNILNTSKI